MGIVELPIRMLVLAPNERRCISLTTPVTLSPLGRDGYKLVLYHGVRAVRVLSLRTNLMYLNECDRPGTDFTELGRANYIHGVVVPQGANVVLEIENQTEEAVKVDGKLVGLAMQEGREVSEIALDLTRIFQLQGGGELWMGAEPPQGASLSTLATHLVLAARGAQAPASAFPGVTVLHCPLDDTDPLPLTSLPLVFMTARLVAELLKNPRTVIAVTCEMGLNRSGLIAALAMRLAVGKDSETFDPVEIIRKHRGPSALGNTGFRMLIDGRDERAHIYLPQSTRTSAFGEIEP